MLIVNGDNFKAEVEENEGLVVIDLFADWCGPCRMLAPVIDELASEYGDVKFCKINVDNSPELAAAFGVTSIPTVTFVKNNTLMDLSVGFVPKASLVKMIEEYR